MEKWILLAVGLCYFFFCFLWHWLRIRKQIGKNPIRFGSGNSLKSFVGKVFLVLIVSEALAAYVFGAFPESYALYLLPMNSLNSLFVKAIGLALMLFSMTLTCVAQYQMGASWRVGIDENTKTDLVISGLYHFSRNPIYTGMFAGAIGFFLFLPNALTFACLCCAYLILRVEIHLEEEHMLQLYPEQYATYMQKVRRWL